MGLKRIGDPTVQRIEADLSVFKGKEAILRERPLIVLVCLQDVCVDNDQVCVGGIVIRTPGLWSFKDRWQVGSVWEFVSLDSGYWSSAFCRWSLNFNPEAIQAVRTLAAGLSDIDAEWQSCDTAEKRKNFFNDYDGPLWQHYLALAPALDRFGPRAGNSRDRIFP